jgi:hypothetical protein
VHTDDQRKIFQARVSCLTEGYIRDMLVDAFKGVLAERKPLREGVLQQTVCGFD